MRYWELKRNGVVFATGTSKREPTKAETDMLYAFTKWLDSQEPGGLTLNSRGVNKTS